MRLGGFPERSSCFTAFFFSLATMIATAHAAALLPVGAWYPDRDPHDVQVVGNRAYHAAGAAGLLILDVTDPNNPVQLGVYHDPAGEALAVAVQGDYAFVAFGARELQIVNIADPANPFRAAGFYATYRPSGGAYGTGDTTVSAADLVLEGNIVYLADGISGLQIVDISNPTNPTGLSVYPAPGAAYQVQLKNKVVTLESYGVAFQMGGECLVNVSNPRSPTLVSPCGPPSSLLGVMTVASAGNILYEGSFPVGFEILDISTPSRPVRLGGLPTTAYIFDIAIEQNLALVANYSAGAQIIDVSNPASPKILANYPAPNGTNVYGVALAGNIGYVTLRNLHIIDLSVPASPKLLAVYQADTANVTVAGNLAFLPEANQVEIVNVSDPRHPAHVANLTVSGVREVAIQDKLAYLAGDNGLSIFDITDPSIPAPLGAYTLQTRYVFGASLALKGHYAFVGANIGGVLVFDVHNPAAPTLLGSYDTAGWTTSVAVSDTAPQVFAADGPAGVKTFTETFSSAPRVTLNLSNGAPTIQITGQADAEYIVECNTDLSNQSGWIPLGSFVLQNTAQAVPDLSSIGKQRFYRVRQK
jgi:hypothetical protein